jgi:hypothetical protein
MQLRHELETIHRYGAELVLVGNGIPAQAKVFQKHMQLATPLFVDPQLALYRALGMRRSIWRTIGPSAWGNFLRALRAGSRQQQLQGDPWQQGGVLIVLPDGRVVYCYRSKVAGDHPPIRAVLEALRSAWNPGFEQIS